MSLQMRAVGLYMRLGRKRVFADPEGGAALLAAPKNDPEPDSRTMDGLHVTQHEIGGFSAYAVVRPGLDRYQVPTLLYLHGGAFVSTITKHHWRLIARLARDLDVTVLVPMYGLAPEHTAAEARDLVAEYVARAEQEGRRMYLVGDSAGGNLALIGAQQAAARGLGCVVGLSVMAPWLDLSMANPELDAAERRDPWLSRAALREVARTWADGTPLDDPSVSPLFGSFAGLGPVDIWIGDRDLCLPDARLLRDAVLAAGGTVTYREEPGALHVYPLLPTPEGRRARDELVEHIRVTLGI